MTLTGNEERVWATLGKTGRWREKTLFIQIHVRSRTVS